MKYLMLDHGGVLHGVAKKGQPGVNDLLLRDLGNGFSQVLPNGVLIVQKLSELVSNHGYQIVFHSEGIEDDQLRSIEQLLAACRAKGLAFPAIAAMAVCDPGEYKGHTSDKPFIITNRPHGIKMAAYAGEKPGKACVRAALSAMLRIEEVNRRDCIVFDDADSVIQQAESEGYQTKQLGNLELALDEVLQDERRHARGLESKTEITPLEFKGSDRVEEKSAVEQNKEGEVVALLDVDDTLIGAKSFFTVIHRTKLEFEQSCKIDISLLAALKSNGLNAVYLFTDMNIAPQDIFFCFMLVKYLEGEGFKMNGVVTPPDVFINRASEEQLRQLDESFMKRLAAGKGALSEQEERALEDERRVIAVALLQQKQLALAPGAMFDVALKKYLGDANYSKYQAMTFQQLLGSDFQSFVTEGFYWHRQQNAAELNLLRLQAGLLKALTDSAIQGQHSKGLLFKELVIQRNIQKVFYADDHVGAVESVRRQAQAIPTVGTSVLYVPRADKREAAYQEAYYELREDHYEAAAWGAKKAKPGVHILMDKNAARFVNKTHEKVYAEICKMTENYLKEVKGLEEKDPVLASKKQVISALQVALENKQVSKLKRLENFSTLLLKSNRTLLNQHRTDAWKRYMSNVLSVLTVLPFLARAAHSYYKYATVQFWKPESEKVILFALNECAKLRL